MMKMLLTLGVSALAAVGLCADRSVKKSVVVNAPVAEVWKAWTTSEGIATFFAPSSKIELKPGGRFDILFDATAPPGLRGAEGCQVLSYIPEKMLSFSWNSPPTLPVMRLRNTFVVIELSPVEGGKTKVDLTNGGYRDGAEWDQAYAYFDKAWDFVLNSLADRFSKGPREWPKPSTEKQPEVAPSTAKVLAELGRFVGGKWTAEVKGPEGLLKVEFTYKWHPDKKGIVGSGVIGKGSAHPVYVNNAFGIDPMNGSVYYLDSHNSGTVYWGHVAMDGEDLVFVFGPAGGSIDTFTSKGRFADKDSYDNKIRQANGQEIVGFTLKRVKG